MSVIKTWEPAHDKTYNKTCAISEGSDQPAHPRSLIRVFADRMCPLQPPGYPKRDKRKSFLEREDDELLREDGVRSVDLFQMVAR